MSKNNQNQNNFREWVSDNLRYILLIIGILAALVAIFFGVRAISSSLNGSSSASGSKDDVKSGVISEAEAAASGESVSAGGTETASGSEETELLITSSGESGAAAAGATAAQAGTSGAVLEESRNQDIVQLICDYYSALSVQDLSQIQKITDTLPEDQAASISSSKWNYSGVKVYTKDGLNDNTKVVYAYYKYSSGAGSPSYPGLSQMLVRRGVDGNWKLVFSELDQETIDFITEVTKEADVQALIAQVTQEYEEIAGKSSSTNPSDDTAVKADTAKTASTSAQAELAGESASEQEEAGQEEAEQEETAEDGEETDGSDEEEGSDEEASDETEENSEEGEEEQEDTSDQEWAATVNSSCNVRSGPGYDYAVISGVSEGSDVTVIGDIVNGWWHIRTDETEGYIGGKFID